MPYFSASFCAVAGTISATATSAAPGRLRMASACVGPITPVPIIPKRSCSVIALILLAQYLCRFLEKMLKRLIESISRSLQDHQQAHSPNLDHCLPRAYRLGAQKCIVIAAKERGFVIIVAARAGRLKGWDPGGRPF